MNVKVDTNEILGNIESLQNSTKIANTDLKKVLALRRMLINERDNFQSALQNGPAEEIDKMGIRILALFDALDIEILNFADAYSYVEEKIFNLDMNIPVTPRIVKGGAQ